jgi:hypothetical protein
MTHRQQLTPPMVRAATRLQRNQTAWMCCEKVEQLTARDPPAEHCSSGRIRSVRVENMLGDIQPNRDSL